MNEIVFTSETYNLNLENTNKYIYYNRYTNIKVKITDNHSFTVLSSYCS